VSLPGEAWGVRECGARSREPAAPDLRGVVSSPVEKAPLAEAWVRSSLHFKVYVFASRELDADIEDDASVILGFFGRLRI